MSTTEQISSDRWRMMCLYQERIGEMEKETSDRSMRGSDGESEAEDGVLSFPGPRRNGDSE